MIRPTSKIRAFHFVNDFQIFKGGSAETMKPFGMPVAAPHEARLIIRDDQKKNSSEAMYAIHQRSENRILQIVERTKATTVITPINSRRSAAMSTSCVPVFKAA